MPQFGHCNGEQSDFVHFHPHRSRRGVLGSLEQIILGPIQGLAVRAEAMTFDHEGHQSRLVPPIA